MDYFSFTKSMIAYIESRVRESEIDKKQLEKNMSMSYAHIRDVFQSCTGAPLGRYILSRKISNAAYMLKHGDWKILDIAMELGFESHDSFSRAFKRILGETPREFRKSSRHASRIKLAGGIYGPYIENSLMEETMKRQGMENQDGSCLLYGIGKVEYTREECTPYPAALRSCLNYLGQEISYGELMAATGASFRLRWNTEFWDGGNVDISCIYEDPQEAYRRGLEAAGRSYRFLMREKISKKKEFIDFIRQEIDAGRPLLAFGIIGPPEACIITGYREEGEKLLGWNFFQNNPEFASLSEEDASGYFICSSWWENPETTGLIAIGEYTPHELDHKSILINALDVLTTKKAGPFAGGPAAYKAWAHALGDEEQISEGMPLPKLFERLMCQNDALTMVAEGRAYAASYLEQVAGELKNENRSAADLLKKAAECFRKEQQSAMKMPELIGGFYGEKEAKNLARTVVRKEIIRQINHAGELDNEAAGYLKEALELI